MALTMQWSGTLNPGEESAQVFFASATNIISVRFPEINDDAVRRYGDLHVRRMATFTGVGLISTLIDWRGVWLPFTVIGIPSNTGTPSAAFRLSKLYPEALDVQLWRGT